MKYSIVAALVMALIGTSCSTMKESLTVGIGSGLATGASAGALLYRNNKSKYALKGALIGGAIGGIASYFIHKALGKRDSNLRTKTLLNLEKYNVNNIPKHYGNSPTITKPVVESQWIETQIKGKKLIEGHKVWVISEDSTWLLNQPKEEKK